MPVLPSSGKVAPSVGDLARGRKGLLLWGAPIAFTLAASAITSISAVSVSIWSILLVSGTLWLGLTCLANARRCGRTHCWIDGTFLPALSVAGGLALIGWIPLSWNTFRSILWVIVIGAFVVEWGFGPYTGG